MHDNHHSILALDVGEKRIGVAMASPITRLAKPLTTISGEDDPVEIVRELVEEHRVGTLVVGLPRSLEGESTKQTEYVENFGVALDKHIQVPIHWQDEAVTSIRAEEELRERGKPYQKSDIDALAACYILEDYLHEHAMEHIA